MLIGSYIDIHKFSGGDEFLSDWQEKGGYSWHFHWTRHGTEYYEGIVNGNGSCSSLDSTIKDIKQFLQCLAIECEVRQCHNGNVLVPGTKMFTYKPKKRE